MSKKVNVVILTALEEERDAVLLFLENTKEEPKSGRIDRVFTSEKYNYRIVLVCINDMGRVAASTTVNQIINDYSPKYIILTGIAGGVEKKGVKCGDLIIADRVVDFSLGKETRIEESEEIKDITEIRPDDYQMSLSLLKKFRDFKDNNEKLLSQISELCCMNKFKPTIHIKHAACTDRVIANETSIKNLLQQRSDLYCFEMEGSGVAYAAQFSHEKNINVFFIKGISDVGIGKDIDDKWRNYARNIAAFYTVKFINYLRDNNFFHLIQPNQKGYWLIKEPELWNSYIDVLHFSKKIHNMFQPLDISALKSVKEKCFENEKNSNLENKNKLLEAWNNYVKDYQERNDELLKTFLSTNNDINILTKHVDKEFKKFQSIQSSSIIQDKIQKIESFYQEIKEMLKEYQVAHDELLSSMKSKVPNSQDEIFSNYLLKLTGNARRLITSSDTLIKLLVEILLQK